MMKVKFVHVFGEVANSRASLLEHTRFGIHAEFCGLKGFVWLYGSHFRKAPTFCICICTFLYSLWWQLPAHLCFLSVSGCLTFLSSFVCQHARMTLYQCMCVCARACLCVCVRMGNEQSVMPEREPSLFKLPSGFQASHLQTGTSCSPSLTLSLSLSLLHPLSLLCMSASVYPPILYVCLYSVLPRLFFYFICLFFSSLSVSVSFPPWCTSVLKTTTLLSFLCKRTDAVILLMCRFTCSIILTQEKHFMPTCCPQ